MNRFRLASRSIYSRSTLLPANKNSKKPDKVIGSDGKLSEKDSSISTKDIAADIMNGLPASDNPEAALQKIFFFLAVLPSIELGLIDPDCLTLSGDGTAVVSHASPYGKPLSSCGRSRPYRNSCRRHYSDPDADWGWDGHKMCLRVHDPVKNAHKYRCPLKCGRIASCPYAENVPPAVMNARHMNGSMTVSLTTIVCSI